MADADYCICVLKLLDFAENVNTCRHVVRCLVRHLAGEYVLTHDSVLQLICKYFGEKINPRDPEVVKTYCDKMCDVRAALSASPLFPPSPRLSPL